MMQQIDCVEAEAIQAVTEASRRLPKAHRHRPEARLTCRRRHGGNSLMLGMIPQQSAPRRMRLVRDDRCGERCPGALTAGPAIHTRGSWSASIRL